MINTSKSNPAFDIFSYMPVISNVFSSQSVGALSSVTLLDISGNGLITDIHAVTPTVNFAVDLIIDGATYNLQSALSVPANSLVVSNSTYTYYGLVINGLIPFHTNFKVNLRNTTSSSQTTINSQVCASYLLK